MITTYSYLDQYKQIGAGNPIEYFIQITKTPYPLNISIAQSLEYGIAIAQSLEYGIAIAQSLEYGIAIAQSGGAS